MDTLHAPVPNHNPSNPPVWKEFPIEKIYVDHDYQQPFDERWCSYLVDNWDGNAAGALLVSVHEDGSAATPDGQHRLGAMRRLGITHWQCECHYGLTHQQEASLFRTRNNRKAVHPIFKFRARVAEGEATANAIKDILKNYGVAINVQSPADAPYYGCVGPIEKAFTDGVLNEVIRIIETCWKQHNRMARSQVVVDGLTLFLNNYIYHANFLMAVALEKFSNPNNDPRKMKFPALKQKAKTDADALGVSQAFQFARLLREVYNKGGRSRILPELRS